MIVCRLKLMYGVKVFSLLISMYSHASNYDDPQTALVKTLCTNVIHDGIQRAQACDVSDDHDGQNNIVVAAQDDSSLEIFDYFGVLNDEEQRVLHRLIPYFQDAIEYQNSLPTLQGTIQDVIKDEYDLRKIHHREVLDQLTIRSWNASLKKNKD